jgi:signal peptidase I
MSNKTFTSEAIDFVKDLIIISLVVLLIRTFLVMPFQISGQSMYSAYYDREFIIVDRFSYLNIPYTNSKPKR